LLLKKQRSGALWFEASLGKQFTNIGLVEDEGLSSSPSTSKKKKKKTDIMLFAGKWLELEILC
jgi:hypothetical protein